MMSSESFERSLEQRLESVLESFLHEYEQNHPSSLRGNDDFYIKLYNQVVDKHFNKVENDFFDCIINFVESKINSFQLSLLTSLGSPSVSLSLPSKSSSSSLSETTATSSSLSPPPIETVTSTTLIEANSAASSKPPSPWVSSSSATRKWEPLPGDSMSLNIVSKSSSSSSSTTTATNRDSKTSSSLQSFNQYQKPPRSILTTNNSPTLSESYISSASSSSSSSSTTMSSSSLSAAFSSSSSNMSIKVKPKVEKKRVQLISSSNDASMVGNLESKSSSNPNLSPSPSLIPHLIGSQQDIQSVRSSSSSSSTLFVSATSSFDKPSSVSNFSVMASNSSSSSSSINCSSSSSSSFANSIIADVIDPTNFKSSNSNSNSNLLSDKASKDSHIDPVRSAASSPTVSSSSPSYSFRLRSESMKVKFRNLSESLGYFTGISTVMQKWTIQQVFTILNKCIFILEASHSSHHNIHFSNNLSSTDSETDETQAKGIDQHTKLTSVLECAEDVLSFLLLILTQTKQILKCLGHSIIVRLLKLEAVRIGFPKVYEELSLSLEDLYTIESVENRNFNLAEIFIRPFRDDVDSRLEYDKRMEGSIFVLRERSYDMLNSLFHKFAEVSEGTQMQLVLWLQNDFPLKIKGILSTLNDLSYPWFVSMFTQLLLFQSYKPLQSSKLNNKSSNSNSNSSSNNNESYSKSSPSLSASASGAGGGGSGRIDKKLSKADKLPEPDYYEGPSIQFPSAQQFFFRFIVHSNDNVFCKYLSEYISCEIVNLVDAESFTTIASPISSSPLTLPASPENNPEDNFFNRISASVDPSKISSDIVSDQFQNSNSNDSSSGINNNSSNNNNSNNSNNSSSNKDRNKHNLASAFDSKPVTYESYTLRLMKLKVLGKFFGLLIFYPQWTLSLSKLSETGPLHQLAEEHSKKRSFLRAVLPIRMEVEKAWMSGNLSVVLPWIVEFLSMSFWDSTMHINNPYNDVIKMMMNMRTHQLFDLRRSDLSSNRVYTLHVIQSFKRTLPKTVLDSILYCKENCKLPNLARQSQDKFTVDDQNNSFCGKFNQYIIPWLSSKNNGGVYSKKSILTSYINSSSSSSNNATSGDTSRSLLKSPIDSTAFGINTSLANDAAGTKSINHDMPLSLKKPIIDGSSSPRSSKGERSSSYSNETAPSPRSALKQRNAGGFNISLAGINSGVKYAGNMPSSLVLMSPPSKPSGGGGGSFLLNTVGTAYSNANQSEMAEMMIRLENAFWGQYPMYRQIYSALTEHFYACRRAHLRQQVTSSIFELATKNNALSNECLTSIPPASLESYGERLVALGKETERSNEAKGKQFLDTFIATYISNTLSELVDMYPLPSSKVADLAKYYMKFHCNSQAPELLEFMKSYSKKKVNESVAKCNQAYASSLSRQIRVNSDASALVLASASAAVATRTSNNNANRPTSPDKDIVSLIDSPIKSKRLREVDPNSPSLSSFIYSTLASNHGTQVPSKSFAQILGIKSGLMTANNSSTLEVIKSINDILTSPETNKLKIDLDKSGSLLSQYFEIAIQEGVLDNINKDKKDTKLSSSSSSPSSSSSFSSTPFTWGSIYSHELVFSFDNHMLHSKFHNNSIHNKNILRSILQWVVQCTICTAQLLSKAQIEIDKLPQTENYTAKRNDYAIEINTVCRNITALWASLASFMRFIKFEVLSKIELFFPVSVSIVKAIVIVLPYLISIDNAVVLNPISNSSATTTNIDNKNFNSINSIKSTRCSEICIILGKQTLIEHSTLAQIFVVLGRPSSAAFHEKCKDLYKYREIVKPFMRTLVRQLLELVFVSLKLVDGAEVHLANDGDGDGDGNNKSNGSSSDCYERLSMSSVKVVQMAKTRFSNDFGILVENLVKSP